MRRKIIPYNPALKERARAMRRNPTPTENYLWEFLKGKQVRGYDFHRQKPLGNYIVDFFCSELLLAVEVDGSSHDGRFDEDEVREESLDRFGISFLRFSNESVASHVSDVIRTIETWIDDHADEILRPDAER